MVTSKFQDRSKTAGCWGTTEPYTRRVPCWCVPRRGHRWWLCFPSPPSSLQLLLWLSSSLVSFFFSYFFLKMHTFFQSVFFFTSLVVVFSFASIITAAVIVALIKPGRFFFFCTYTLVMAGPVAQMVTCAVSYRTAFNWYEFDPRAVQPLFGTSFSKMSLR